VLHQAVYFVEQFHCNAAWDIQCGEAIWSMRVKGLSVLVLPTHQDTRLDPKVLCMMSPQHSVSSMGISRRRCLKVFATVRGVQEPVSVCQRGVL
jgi:hypothetical protein